jgi:hypothetical protein
MGEWPRISRNRAVMQYWISLEGSPLSPNRFINPAPSSLACRANRNSADSDDRKNPASCHRRRRNAATWWAGCPATMAT